MKPIRHRKRPIVASRSQTRNESGGGVAPIAVLSQPEDPVLGWANAIPLQIEHRPVAELIPPANNARTHSKKQITKLAAAIRQFGFTNPIVIDEKGCVIAGHGRLAAAKSMGMREVPTIRLAHLSADEKWAYILADNKLAELPG